MIYLYTPKKSDGARLLTKWINENGGKATRLTTMRNVDWGLDEWIVNWGARVPIGVQKCPGLLNARIIHNKYKELLVLTDVGVNAVQVSDSPKPGWLARRFMHQEANDLRAHLTTGDYYVKYVPTTHEFRVHVFRGLIIRVALKVPRIAKPEPMFRSWSAGWKFSYGADCQELITDTVRRAARKAVNALGYDFGAVDIGIPYSGAPIVFEVNSAPGLEGGTIDAYGRQILKWAS